MTAPTLSRFSIHAGQLVAQPVALRPQATKPPILASGQQVDPPKSRAQAQPNTWSAERAERAWHHRHALGEAGYAALFYRMACSKLTIQPSIRMPDGTVEPDTDPRALALVAGLEDVDTAGDGILEDDDPATLQSQFADHIFTVGETWLVITDLPNGTTTYTALSSRELVSKDGAWWYKAHPAAKSKRLDPQPKAVRIWENDPEWRALGEGSLMRVERACEVLLTLDDEFIAVARSRINAGILAVPDGLKGEPVDPDDPDAPTEFDRDLRMVLTSSVENDRSPARVTPFIVNGSKEDLAQQVFRHIDLARPSDAQAVAKAIHYINRFAQGIDLPVEIITGLGSANHWGGGEIQDATYEAHVKPKSLIYYRGMTSGWYRPALAALGVRDIGRRMLLPDPSSLLREPDQTDAAKTGHTEGLISDATWRRVHGFDEDDAPDDVERAKWMGVRAVNPRLAITGDVTALPEGPVRVTEREQIDNPDVPTSEPIDKGPTPASLPASKTAPPQKALAAAAVVDTTATQRKRPVKLQRLARVLSDGDTRLRERLTVAADAAMRRALERAGLKVRTAATRNGAGTTAARKAALSALEELPLIEIAGNLGAERLHELGVSEDELFDDAFGDYGQQADRWLSDWQRLALHRTGAAVSDEGDGYPAEETKFDEARGLAVPMLVAGLVSLAKERLYAPHPSSSPGEVSGMLVDPTLIRTALTVAGGGPPTVREAAAQMVDGIGNGVITRSLLSANGVMTDEGYEWQWSGLSFPPHEDLDGVPFTGEDDPVLSETLAGFEWIGQSCWPGDHSGCACSCLARLSVEYDVTEEAAA